MHKIKFISNWNQTEINKFFQELVLDEFSKPIELYIDKVPGKIEDHNIKRIVFFLEPVGIANQLCGPINKQIIENIDNFDFILTHNQEIIEKIPHKAFLFTYGTTWIENYQFPKKEFGISTVVGDKLMVEGHRLRHDVWNNQEKIKNPTKFFISQHSRIINNRFNNPILLDSKIPLFDSQFHICIENEKRLNWFSEKLIDCFITKTIPIYWGAPNIEKWFNTKGMFIVNDLNDIIEVCNSINENTYCNMLEYNEENFKKSKEFTNIGERIKNTICQLLGMM